MALMTMFLSACSDNFRQGVATQGAALADDVLEDAEWMLCSAASIGSVKRRYGRDPKTAAAYVKLCDGDSASKALLIGGVADAQ